MATIPTIPIVNSADLYVDGLALTYISDTLFSIEIGAARDSKDKNDIILNAQVIINVLTNGPNGLDEGALDLIKSYAVYVIADSTGYKPVAGIISINQVAPVLPVGYDMFRRVGWVATGSSFSILKFYQYGDDKTRSYYYDELNLVLFGGSSTTFDPVDLYPFVPSIKTEVIFRVEYAADATTNSLVLSPYGVTGTNGFVVFSCATTDLVYASLSVPAEISDISGTAAIVYKNGLDDGVTLAVTGYKDYL